jgi:Na+-driven multidrug efflux pump
MISLFSSDPHVIDVGEEYLRIISWNFVASGVVFVASSMFQAIGNTIPSLIGSAVRIALVSVPALALSRVPGFQLRWVWYLAVMAVTVHLVLSLGLLRREMRIRLDHAKHPEIASRVATPAAEEELTETTVIG